MQKEITTKQIEDALVMNNAALWTMKYKKIKNQSTNYFSKRNPFGFRPWQTAILNDEHPFVVEEKARQLGMSELAVSQSLYYIFKYDPIKVVYVFPKASQVNDFSRTRFAPVLADPYFKQYITGSDAISLKKVKESYIFFRASFGEKGASNAEGIDS